jgi:hypothetical protein
MTLQFIGDAGIYVPKSDAVKITAVHGGAPVTCYVKRSALVALGCHPTDDPATLLEVFARHRERAEKIAARKFARSHFAEITVSAEDVLESGR